MSKIAFKRANVVFERDFKEFINWKAFRLILVIFLILSVAAQWELNT